MLCSFVKKLKGFVKNLKGIIKRTTNKVEYKYKYIEIPAPPNLNGLQIKIDLEFVFTKVREYIKSLYLGNSNYSFSKSSNEWTLYSNIFAYHTLFILSKFYGSSIDDHIYQGLNEIISNQNEEGIIIDKKNFNAIYLNSDWWGARHLTLIVTDLATLIGFDIKKKIKVLSTEEQYRKLENEFLFFLESPNFVSDIDNKIMNVIGLAQYARDYQNENNSEFIKKFQKLLLEKMLSDGTWAWSFEGLSDWEKSRVVQFCYHIYINLIYDNILPDIGFKLEKEILKGQNQYGGFAPHWNSSACEDIDSIFLLKKLKSAPSKSSLEKAAFRILQNQNDDGGFVFKRDEEFTYGSKLLSSMPNESNVFATWFRLLSILYLIDQPEPRLKFKTTGYYNL